MKKQRRQSPQHRWVRDPAKKEFWQTQVAAWQNSRLSVRAFCKEHGIIETSFYAWRRELIGTFAYLCEVQANHTNEILASDFALILSGINPARGKTRKRFKPPQEARAK